MVVHRVIGRILIWAAIGAVVVMLYVPLIPPILLSLAPAQADERGISFHAYAEIGRNPVLVSAIVTTAQTALIASILAPLLGLFAAMAIRELRASRLVLFLMLLPLFIPGISLGLAAGFFFRQFDVAPSLFTIAIVQILWALPFATLIILTAMSTFDPVYLEAAYMSGAGRLRAFMDIELPLIRAGLTGAASFSFVLSFNETIRTSIVQGPLNTVQTYIWSTYKQIGLSQVLYALMSLIIVLTVIFSGVSLIQGRSSVKSD